MLHSVTSNMVKINILLCPAFISKDIIGNGNGVGRWCVTRLCGAFNNIV